VPTNQQRREAERRRLQRQLEERRAREAARKRTTLIASIVGTLVVIALVVVVVVVSTSGSDKKNPGALDANTVSSPAPTTTSSLPAMPLPTKPCSSAPKGDTATYQGLTVKGATDLKHEPKVSGKSITDPTSLTCKDLVVGKGAVAKSGTSVTVQYVGVVYKTGTVFQSSWSSQAATFGLAQGQVIDGFFQGIAGAGKVGPMHVGGRRIIVMPAADAYGANPPQGSNIPANAALVFVVDLQKVT
jgi:FKBP-type peptidyl-prolyl cis-trans isomerase